MRRLISWQQPEILCAAADQLQVKRLLLVHGSTAFSASGAREFIRTALGAKVAVSHQLARTNPRESDFAAAVAAARAGNCDGVLGVGGGSVLDTAKMVRYLLAASNRHVPLILLPTTAGSGAEATAFTAVYSAHGKKSIEHSAMLPDVIVSDASFSSSMTPYVTACCGLDAVCHAIEAAWSIGSTVASRRHAKRALELIGQFLPTATEHGTRLAREAMVEASYEAGCAIAIAKTTAPHALSYYLTIHHAVPHGHAVALCMGSILRLHELLATSGRPGALPVLSMQDELLSILGCCGSAGWAAWLTRVGLTSQSGVLGSGSQQQRMEMAAAVDLHRLSNHPLRLDHADLVTSLSMT